MKRIRGRVVDTWSPGNGKIGVVVAEGTARHLLVVGQAVAAGAIIDARVVEGGVAEELTILGTPERPPAIDGDALRWRAPGTGVSRMECLTQRHAILRAVRAWFDGEAFLEFETPLLVRGAAPEPHLDSFRVGSEYLATSTEYQLKRLVVGGFDRVYSLTQNFRTGELGALHNPEFTMLEWARAYESMRQIEADAEAFVVAALDAVRPGAKVIKRGPNEVQIAGRAWERLTVREAVRLHAGLKLDAECSLESIRTEVARTGLAIPAEFLDDSWHAVSWLVAEIQPHLGCRVPLFLTDWPSFMTPSAGLAAESAGVADRSELFIAGIEVSDGFSFARDASEQRRRFAEALEQRRALGKDAVDVDLRYVEALEEGLPPGAGMALGIDRLVMLLTGAETLREVLPFAWDER